MALFNIVFLGLIVSSKSQNHFFGNLPVVSDLKPEDCFKLGEKYDPDSVLPTCTPFSNDEEGCIGYHNLNSTIKNKPTCTKNGEFAPVQCKAERSTGRCFCFDATGNRIFGQEWWNRADDMTCACSRKKADMAAMDDPLYFNSLHCNSVGNYEALQCDVVSGMCWCANEKTGDLKSPVVPEKAMSKLSCYPSTEIGTQYLRQCESKKYAQERITHEFNLRGTAIHLLDFLCDDDGSFGAYTIIDGSAYCTWRDNSKIGSWQTGNNRNEVDCNCARDLKFFEQAGKVQTQQCASNGNYQEYQSLNSKNYCVDRDGYMKSPDGVQVEGPEDCSTFSAYH